MINLPGTGEWTFDSESVAGNFDAHVREQLPWYDMTSRAIAHMARHYLPENGVMYDIGAATGNLGLALSETLQSRNVSYRPIEPSEKMARAYRGPGKLITSRVEDVEVEPFDFAVSHLTMMFLPIGSRKDVLSELQFKIKPGGALVLVEKMETASGYLATVLMRLVLSEKLNSGALPDDILKKELSLSGVQVPLRLWELPDGSVEWFRFGDFAGYIVTR